MCHQEQLFAVNQYKMFYSIFITPFIPVITLFFSNNFFCSKGQALFQEKK